MYIYKENLFDNAKPNKYASKDNNRVFYQSTHDLARFSIDLAN